MNTLMNKRIFLVDDDPYWTAILQRILSDLNHTDIISFSTGSECVNNLHLNPALVFLDYQMDDMNGIEVLKRIKAHYPGIGVIFCTAYEDLAVAIDAMEHGSYDYLLKGNATIKEVNSIVEALIASQESVIIK
ncbi:MAG: response regulator [Saprospiraceae bacterium]|nr:response regulator [Saprospiraceae bacterium]